MTGYVCKYAPIELMAGFGEQAELIVPEESGNVGERIHPNLCSYAKAVLHAVLEKGYDSVLLTDCCDSLKRVADIIRQQCDIPVYVLSLPRVETPEAAGFYAGEMQRFIDAYARDFGKDFNASLLHRETTVRQQADEPHIALYGARAPGWLVQKSNALCSLPVVDYTCALQQRIAPPQGEGFLTAYARELLGQSPCMRMWDTSRRGGIVENENIRGIIHHTVKFCDFYGFERIGLQHDVPLLRLETNYEQLAGGQVLTNLQAFYEANGWRAEEKKENRSMQGQAKKKAYYAGIDSGSTTTKVAILDEGGNIAGTAILPTGAKSQDSAIKTFGKAMMAVGITREPIQCIVSTGYGRHALKWTDKDITEISCHARGANYLFPQARTVIDIGGQDSKVIQIDENGSVMDFTMNDKCAAGTGKFLEIMADSLGTDIKTFAMLGLDWKEDIVISSMCAVFAESEVVSLIAENKEKPDIIHGLNNSVASRVYASVARQDAQPDYVMTGGVAYNTGVVKELEAKLGTNLLIPEQPEICGALGAAIFAMEM